MRIPFYIFLALALAGSWAIPSTAASDADKAESAENAAPRLPIVLSAEKATLEGPSVRFDKATSAVLKWSSRKDRAKWIAQEIAAGTYDVAITWHVAKHADQQPYNIDIDGSDIIRGYTRFTEATGFTRQSVGRILLSAGQHEIVFRPSANVKGDLAAVRSVEFLPVDPAAADWQIAPFAAAPLSVPDGFEVTLVASPPLVSHPMMADFDDRGRLFVAESAGVNADGNALQQNPPSEIRVLEDTNGDGTFDRATLFADKMAFPQGMLYHDGAVYLASPPSFWRLRDTDGDGVADERTEIATGFPYFKGMSDDVHGGTLAPDGRIYWAAGRYPHEIRMPGGKLIHKGSEPLVLRCRPDGSEVELFSGTLGNAVGVAFSAAGDCFASGTFADNGPGLRDGLDHCIEGAAYPVKGRSTSELTWTGGMMPVLAELGVSASSDLTIYRGTSFGQPYSGNLFSALFNMHKVSRHILEPAGATYRCTTEDFLVSESPDFHPTDVLEDADGSLLVIDTGGWFIIGCPTSQIGKPQVRGGIYRIRRRDATSVADSRGLKTDWARSSSTALVALLDDDRFAVRDRAIVELSRRTAVKELGAALGEAPSPRLRLNAVWALARIDSPDARAANRQALDDRDSSVRQAAATSAGLNRDREAVAQLIVLVGTDTLAVRRQAAAALGRIGDPRAVPALLAALPAATDRFLEHALIYAAIQLDDREQTRSALVNSQPSIRRGALIALDQMEHGNLSREQVAEALADSDMLVQRTALEIIEHHRGWGREIIGLARTWLSDADLSAEKQEALWGVLSAFASDAAIEKLIGITLSQPDTPRWTKLGVLDVMARSESRKVPEAWQKPLLAALESTDSEIVRRALAASGAFDPPLGSEEIVEIARDPSHPPDVRVVAASLVARLSKQPLDEGLFEWLCDQTGGGGESVLRLMASRAIGESVLSETQRKRVAELIARAGPLELPGLLSAFERSPTAEAGTALVAALDATPYPAAIPSARLAKLFDTYPAEVRTAAAPLLSRINVGHEAQAARLEELQDLLTGGDASRGRQVFYGQKASCSACHRVGGEGGNVGPVLTGIGAIRTGRDLLEAIVFPSASFARDFEPVSISTEGGQVFSGIVSRETSDAVYLRIADRSEVRILRNEIEEIAPSSVSIMPQGLDKTLADDELRDLIAFLSGLRTFNEK